MHPGQKVGSTSLVMGSCKLKPHCNANIHACTRMTQRLAVASALEDGEQLENPAVTFESLAVSCKVKYILYLPWIFLARRTEDMSTQRLAHECS